MAATAHDENKTKKTVPIMELFFTTDVLNHQSCSQKKKANFLVKAEYVNIKWDLFLFDLRTLL